MNDDLQLIRDYRACRSELAFETIVARYVNLVYSAALRQVRDPHLAEEVTQTVFILLARKAGSFGPKTVLASWLHRTACFVARDALKSQMRRARREQEAYMRNTPDDACSNQEESWKQMAPLLDAAIAALGEKDRQAILLRFFENRSFGELGNVLGTGEDAARMRVQRALEKLRASLAKQGVACTTVGLGVLLSEKSVAAAPVTLVSSITASVTSGGGAAVSLMDVLRLTARLKSRFLVAIGIGTVAVFVAGVVSYEAMRSANAPVINTAEAVVPVVVGESSNASPVVANVRPVAVAEDDLEELIAQLRAALYSTASKFVPNQQLIHSVKAFGTRGKVAFEVLKEEVAANREAEAFTVESRVRDRAVRGIGFLGRAVPEAAPFLWDLYESFKHGGLDAPTDAVLYALYDFGFEPKDISLLANRVIAFTDFRERDGQVQSQAAKWIAELLKKSPAEAQPFVPDVEQFLHSTNSTVRFWAACALAEYEGERYPGIIDEIVVGLRNDAAITDQDLHESSRRKSVLPWVIDFFRDARPVMKIALPALMQGARESSQKGSRELALLAAGHLDPELRTTDPEIAQLLQGEEEQEAWRTKINSGKANFFELQKDLKDPERAYVAAEELGRMGPVAANAVPDIVRALLASKDSGHGERILEALKKIDPEAAKNYEPVSIEVLQSAMEKVQARHAPSTIDQVSRLVLETMEGSGPLPSRVWLAEFGKKLADVDLEAYRTFVTNVVKRDPSLKSAFVQ